MNTRQRNRFLKNPKLLLGTRWMYVELHPNAYLSDNTYIVEVVDVGKDVHIVTTNSSRFRHWHVPIKDFLAKFSAFIYVGKALYWVQPETYIAVKEPLEEIPHGVGFITGVGNRSISMNVSVYALFSGSEDGSTTMSIYDQSLSSPWARIARLFRRATQPEVLSFRDAVEAKRRELQENFERERARRASEAIAPAPVVQACSVPETEESTPLWDRLGVHNGSEEKDSIQEALGAKNGRPSGVD